jgi:hypothetical protein
VKNAPGGPKQKGAVTKGEEATDVISVKTKKLKDQMKQDEEDFKQEAKLVIPKLHKTIMKASKIGAFFNKYNLRRENYMKTLKALKDKNAKLKQFDELEHYMNSYE